jgi:hypothetical protein
LNWSATRVLQNIEINIQQRRQSADVNNVLEQQPLPGIGEFAATDLSKGNADVMNVVAQHAQIHGLGGVIDKVATGINRLHVLGHALGIHTHHDIRAAATTEITGLGNAYLVPGRHTLDVRREDVPGADRNTHAEYGLCKHSVGTGRPGSVDVGELDDEVVYRLL